jgi:hypothetical protein
VTLDFVLNAVGSAVCQIALVKAWRLGCYWICHWAEHRWEYLDVHEPKHITKTFRKCTRCGHFNFVGEFDAMEPAALRTRDLKAMGAQIPNDRLQPRRANMSVVCPEEPEYGAEPNSQIRSEIASIEAATNRAIRETPRGEPVLLELGKHYDASANQQPVFTSRAVDWALQHSREAGWVVTQCFDARTRTFFLRLNTPDQELDRASGWPVPKVDPARSENPRDALREASNEALMDLDCLRAAFREHRLALNDSAKERAFQIIDTLETTANHLKVLARDRQSYAHPDEDRNTSR